MDHVIRRGVLLGLLAGCSQTNPCPVGTTACPEGCVNLQTDPNHCGACGAVCPSGSCNAGICAQNSTGCSAGTVECGSLGCVAPADCVTGGCAAGEMDCGSGCVAVVSCLPASGECPPGTLNCDNKGCIDPMTSKAHCGQCNYACNGDNLICADGVCSSPCEGGLLPCGGTCTDVSSNIIHCGACNATCPALATCSQSQCVGGRGGRLLNGFFPTTVTVKDAFAAFNQWKQRQVEDCGGGVLRVKFDTPNESQTVSEGIGYGLLLAVGWSDRALFDGIKSYYQSILKTNGLMPWKLDGCNRSAIDAGAASDGDLDAAMALLMAECTWPSSSDYGALAFNAINALRQYVVKTDGSRLLLIAGDSWSSNECANPSYFAPGYYRAFVAAGVPNANDWAKLADDSYYYLSKAANPSTGLVSEWVKGDSLGCSYSPGDYGYNAARTPWRVVTDYTWWKAPQAEQFALTLSNWVSSIGITHVVDGYTLAGTATGQWKNSTFVGGFALSAIPGNQETSNQFHSDWLSYVPLAQDSTYYNSSLRAIYLLLAAQRFVPACY